MIENKEIVGEVEIVITYFEIESLLISTKKLMFKRVDEAICKKLNIDFIDLEYFYDVYHNNFRTISNEISNEIIYKAKFTLKPLKEAFEEQQYIKERLKVGL